MRHVYVDGAAYVHVIVVVLALFFLVRACVDAFSFFYAFTWGERNPHLNILRQKEHYKTRLSSTIAG
jgi:hypothetical protein